MGYLDENPAFHHQLLLVRGDALWLVLDERGVWALPGFVSDEQHTAEVELIAHHMRERFGVRVVILGRVATEFDAVANCVHKADLAGGRSRRRGCPHLQPTRHRRSKCSRLSQSGTRGRRSSRTTSLIGATS